MKFKRSSLRYAHTNGHTAVIFPKNSDGIVTCGTDGDLRRWRDINDDDPTSDCLGEFVCGAAFQDTRLLVCGDRNTVQAYTFPALERDGTLFRFTATATCVCVRGTVVAAGSEDTHIQVLQQEGDEPIQLSGHTGPVLAIDICPAKDLLASVAGDGTLKLWHMSTAKQLKSFDGFLKINSFENATCYGSPSFEPKHGNELAFVRDKEVHVISTDTYELLYKLSDERIVGNYSVCSYSLDGQRLAAGTSDGELSVFHVRQRRALTVEKPPKDAGTLTCIAWHPDDENKLAFCDRDGQLGLLTYDADDIDSVGEPANEEDVDFGDYEFINDEAAAASESETAGSVNADEENEEDDENCVSLEKLKAKVMNASMSANVADSHDDDVDDETNQSVASYAPTTAKAFKQQSAFQPSSSPKDLQHRYMVWNETGIVTSHAEGTSGSIDVEFHDANVHHALHVANHLSHDMASLSTTALALATTNTTKLVVITLTSGPQKEWILDLPDCETIEALACTSKLVGVASSMHFLRIYTVLGTQREIISLPGPVVAIAGHESTLMVVYHSSPSSADQQHLAAYLVHAQSLGLRVQQLAVPLTPGRRLTWLGFTDRGSPAFADSMGLVQLYRAKSGAWFPICDTMQHSASVANNFFVVCVKESQQIVRAVLCRGGTSYPMTTPRPFAQELPMRMLLCDIEQEKSLLENTLLCAAVLQADNSDKSLKESAVKLFALACRTEFEARAKELIGAIACPEVLQLAAKYATKLGRLHMTERLFEMLPQIEQEQALKQRIDAQNGTAIVAPIYVSMPATATDTQTPKPLDIASVKRVSLLKRFNQGTTPTNGSKASRKSPSPVDTQANIFEDSESYSEPSLSAASSVCDAPTPTTPANPVNPFAMKRKLADTGVIFGSDKLKRVKK